MANGRTADPRFVRSVGSRALMDGWSRDNWLLRKPFPYGWVAEADDGTVIAWLDGFPILVSPVLEQPPTARIGNLWVEPAWRRRGIGRALVGAFVAAAAAVDHHFVEVSTLARDDSAVGFWTAMGFGSWRVTLAR